MMVAQLLLPCKQNRSLNTNLNLVLVLDRAICGLLFLRQPPPENKLTIFCVRQLLAEWLSVPDRRAQAHSGGSRFSFPTNTASGINTKFREGNETLSPALPPLSLAPGLKVTGAHFQNSWIEVNKVLRHWMLRKRCLSAKFLLFNH